MLPTQVNFDQSILNLSLFEELFEVKRRVIDAEGQAVGLGHAVNIIGRGHRAGAGHVLHDGGGVSGNIFGQLRRN